MNLRSRISAVVMIAAFLAPAAALAAVSTVTLNEGSEIHVAVQNSVDTGTAYVGQHVTGRVIPPFPEGDYDLDYAMASGKVIKVIPAGQGVNPELHIAWTSLTLQDGTTYPISAEMTNAQVQTQSRNGGHVALTTIGGLIAGNVIGKTIFHAATGIGGVIGAAGGFLIGYNKKSNITLPANAQVTLTLTRPLVVRRQARRP